MTANALSIAAGLPEGTFEGMATDPGTTLTRFVTPTVFAPAAIGKDLHSLYRRKTDPEYKPRSVAGTNMLSFVPFVGGVTRDALNYQHRSDIDRRKSAAKVKAKHRAMGIIY